MNQRVDPLAVPLANWDRGHVAALVGRRESQRLEATETADPKKITREMAGMASAAGGFLVVGAVDRHSVLESIPGVDLDDVELGRLLDSLRDRVRPHGIFSLRSFELQNGRVALVFAVRRPPLGQPVSADGVFYLRLTESAQRMSYSEIRDRFQQSSDAHTIGAASFTISDERPSSSSARTRVCAVETVPLPANDLGLPGRDLLSAWGSAVGDIEPLLQDSAYLRNTPPHLTYAGQTSPQLTGDGLGHVWKGGQFLYGHAGTSRYSVAHDRLSNSGTEDVTAMTLARVAYLNSLLPIKMDQKLGLSGPVLVRASSGTIQRDELEYPPVVITFAVDLWDRPDLDLVNGVELFGQRVVDAVSYGPQNVFDVVNQPSGVPELAKVLLSS